MKPRLIQYPKVMNMQTVNHQELSLAERIQLVEDIWDSIARETSAIHTFPPEVVVEAQRRLNEHRDDPASAVSWSQARAQLFKTVG